MVSHKGLQGELQPGKPLGEEFPEQEAQDQNAQDARHPADDLHALRLMICFSGQSFRTIYSVAQDM